MKIRLINFRSYTDKTFDFDENSLILISGESGAGKSTILMAIQFCLYGKCKKPQTHGQTSCSVEIEFEDMKIVRTKRPDRLVVNDLYEDNIAQNIINKKFGENFDVTSYISQNQLNSFIIMTPSERLEILEKLAFKDVDLSAIKTEIKRHINERNDDLNKTVSQLELAINMLNELKKPEEVKFPFKCKPEDREKITKSEENKVKNSENSIKKLKMQKSHSEKELNELKVLNSFINSKKDIIESLVEQISEISLEEETTTYIGDKKLQEYKDMLQSYLDSKDIIELEKKLLEDQKKLKEMRVMEIEKCKKEIEIINNTLWKEYDKDECLTTIEDTKSYVKDAKKISFLRKQIDLDIKEEDILNKKDELESLRNILNKNKNILENLEKQKTIYVCPNCNTDLKFNNDKLCISVEKIEKEISELKEIKELNEDELRENITNFSKKIRKLETTIVEMETKLRQKEKLEEEIDELTSQYEDELDEDELEEDLSALQEYYETQIKLEKKKINYEKILQEENFSSSYHHFENEVNKLQKKIDNKNNEKIEEYNFENINEEELRNLIIQEENNKSSIERFQRKRKNLEEENIKYKNQLEKMKTKYIENYENIKEESDIENILSNLEVDIKSYEIKRDSAMKNLEKIEKYNKYRLELQKYKKFEDKVNILTNEEDEKRQKYVAATLFKEKVLEAESIAIQNIIETINSHAQLYLDYFFMENPISVKLLSFKETKLKSKPQINLEIDYKGMEVDLNSLSGGELSRVVLAFTLALCEIFHSPLLLLDESTASLNQELTTVVFDAIKSNFKSKTVIIVAHQVVEGVFDKIIKI